MNIPKEALKAAVDGDWIPTKGDFKFKTFTPTTAQAYQISMGDDCIALDPTFWQALGKSLGWRIGEQYGRFKDAEWHNAAHRFYDLILQGKDTEDFWKEILSTKE